MPLQHILNRIGERVDELLDINGMDRIDLAEKVDCDRVTVGRIINGKPTTFHMLDAIATVFNIDVEILMIATEEEYQKFLAEYKATLVHVKRTNHSPQKSKSRV